MNPAAIDLGGVIFCLCISAFFSLTESAFFSISSSKVKVLQTEPRKSSQKIARILSAPQGLIVTLLMCNISANVLTQHCLSELISPDPSWAESVAIPLVCTLLFAELIPKAIGVTNRNVAICHFSVQALLVLQKLLSPIQKALLWASNNSSRALFFFLKKEPEISTEELKYALQKGQNLLLEKEKALIAGCLELRTITLKEVFEPRDQLLLITKEEPLEQIFSLLKQEHYNCAIFITRPLEEITGILSKKTLFLHKEAILSGENIDFFLTKPLLISESLSAHAALKKMIAQQKELAITVNEYGALSGSIRMTELKKIVSNPRSSTGEKNFFKAGQGAIIASGRLELAEFNKYYKSNLVSKNKLVTLGGWIAERLGEIPQTGTVHEASGFAFRVLSAEKTKINRLHITLLKKK